VGTFVLLLRQLKVSALLAAVFVVFGLIVCVSLAWFDHQARQTFVGYLSVASLIFMFASPLSTIVSVLQFYIALKKLVSLISPSSFSS
jgi:hypothetical protein